MRKLSDQEILEAIRNKDDKNSIEFLYKSLLPKVKKHVCSNSGSLDDAYDVFQDAVMTFYRLVISGKFDNSKYSIQGFMFTLSKNLWINLVKKRENSQKREQNVEVEPYSNSVLETIIDSEKKLVLDKLFGTLGEKCIEILTLFYYQKLSIKEISEKIGVMTEDSVKVKSHRCKKLLIEKIKGNKSLIDLLRN